MRCVPSRSFFGLVLCGAVLASVSPSLGAMPQGGPQGSNVQLGSTFTGGGGLFVSDVAYDSLTGRYLALFDGATSNGYIGGRLLAADGTAIGGPLFVTGAQNYVYEPSVAAVDAGTDRFVAVMVGGYLTSEALVVAAFDAEGAERPNMPFGFRNFNTVVVGAGPGDDDAIVVGHSGLGKLEAFEVDVPTLAVTGSVELSMTAIRDVSIAKSGGSRGHYLITWADSTGPGGDDVMGAIVDRDLGVLAPPFVLAGGVRDQRDPHVDGDGNRWLVGYESREVGGPDFDVACRSVHFNPTSGQVTVSPEAVVRGTAGVEERDPVVAWMGESYLVSYLMDFGEGDFDVWVKSVDSLDCMECEGDFKLAASSFPDEGVGIGSQRGGGDPGSGALILWGSFQPFVLTRPVRARLYRADDGLLTELGGGCALGGVVSATCAHVGGSTFGIGVEDAAPAAAAALLLGGVRATSGCGSCQLTTVPVVALPATTDGAGDARYGFALTDPALIGGVLIAQWVIASPPGTGGCAGTLSFSDGLEVTVQ